MTLWLHIEIDWFQKVKKIKEANEVARLGIFFILSFAPNASKTKRNKRTPSNDACFVRFLSNGI